MALRPGILVPLGGIPVVDGFTWSPRPHYVAEVAAGALCVLLAVVGLGSCVSDAPVGNDNATTDVLDDDPDASGGLHDPLSMPAEATLSVESFRSASECAGCHPNHYAQWQTSMHAYATIDPIWRALVAVRQADFDGHPPASAPGACGYLRGNSSYESARCRPVSLWRP